MELEKGKDNKEKSYAPPLEISLCLFYGPGGLFDFKDPEDDRCALKLGLKDDRCDIKTQSYHPPYQMKIAGSDPGWFGCPVNTRENRIKLAENFEEVEKKETEREIKRQGEKYNIVIECCPPGIAIGAIETFVDRSFIKLTPLNGWGRVITKRPRSNLSRFYK